MTAEDTKPGRRERAAAPRTDAGAMDAPNRDVAVQYGRRVEADRSWTVYHVFTGVPAREHDRPMTGLCRSDATRRMLSLNTRHGGGRREEDAPATDTRAPGCATQGYRH